MDSTNLGRRELVASGSLLGSTVQMSSFGGVPEGHVWNQDFLLDGGSSEGMQNMQNNFAPNLNEVLCSRALRHDDHLLNQSCDQTGHLKKMEDCQMSSGWELRNQISSFQAADQNTNIGKHHEQLMPSLSNCNLQWLDDRLHSICTLSDLGSWPISPSPYNSHSGLDMPMPQFQHANVKEECSPVPYPNMFLQGFGSSNPYHNSKNNELGLHGIDILDQSHHANKSMLKPINSNSGHHLGTIMNAADQEYNIGDGGLMLNSSTSPARQSSGFLTFGNSCMGMPVLDFLACKPDSMRLQHPPSTLHFNLQDAKQKHNPTTAQNRSAMSHGFDESASSETKRSSSESASEATFKRPRLESNSALTTFKVRKEKLGDRITALQQLVSPFGKTDTASVLLEAIGYIKFLQEQVQALSMPYMKTGSSTIQGGQEDGNEPKQDLRSRGLCLVPLSCTLHVANDNGSDYWTPSIGATYR